jgi:hypothetical protein
MLRVSDFDRVDARVFEEVKKVTVVALLSLPDSSRGKSSLSVVRMIPGQVPAESVVSTNTCRKFDLG